MFEPNDRGVRPPGKPFPDKRITRARPGGWDPTQVRLMITNPRYAALVSLGREIVKDEHGNTFIEIPVTVAAVGAIAAPVLAALGAISALVAKFSIVVVRSEPKPSE